MSTVKLYVGNIPSAARNSEFKELFEKFGKVSECDILKDYGFVHMESTSDAKAAIAALNDTLWKGSRLRVEISTTRTQKGEPSIRKRYRPPPDSRHRSPPPRDYPPRDYPPPFRTRDPIRDSRYEPYGRNERHHRPYPERRPFSPPPREYRMPPPPPYRGEPYPPRRAYLPPSPPRRIPPREYYRSRSRSPRETSSRYDRYRSPSSSSSRSRH